MVTVREQQQMLLPRRSLLTWAGKLEGDIKTLPIEYLTDSAGPVVSIPDRKFGSFD